MTDDAKKQPVKKSGRSSHRVAATALVIAGTLAAFLAVAAIWVNRQVLDTDNWTDTSSELLEDPAVRGAVSGFLVDQLYANVDVAAEIRQALPPRAQPLAAPAAGAVRNLAEQVTDAMLQRPRVQALWEQANRTAHETFLKIVEGGGPTVSTEGGVVTLDLRSLLEQLEARTGVGGRAAAKLPADAAQVTILRSDQLSFAQDVANALRPLAIGLVVLALAFYGGAVALARDRRRETLRAAGFGFIFAGALALVVKSVAGDAVVSSLASTEAAEPTVEAVWRIGTSLLVEAATATIIYGVAIVAGAWLAGHTRAAVASRRALAPYLRDPAYAWGGTAALVLLLIAWAPTPAFRHLVPTLVLIGLIALGVEALRRQTAREFPTAVRPELGEAVRNAFDRLRGGAKPQRADSTSQLERLADLHDRGVLTDAEFADQKSALLAVR